MTIKGFNIGNLMPHTKEYITYEGSLTVPGCQVARWIFRDRQYDICKDRQSERQTNVKHIYKKTDRQTKRQTNVKHIYKKTDRQTKRQTQRQIDKQKDRQINKQTYIETDRLIVRWIDIFM